MKNRLPQLGKKKIVFLQKPNVENLDLLIKTKKVN